MEMGIFLSIIVVVLVIAQISSIINGKRQEEWLRASFKKNYGKRPTKKYNGNQMDHVPGYFEAHKSESSIDDITWNDLELDDIYQRINYCMSASGEEYLYYSLRNPELSDEELGHLEEQVSFLKENEDNRINLQLIFAKIGMSSKYSIYEYLKFLNTLGKRSNALHFMMLCFLVIAIIEMFISFEVGFLFLIFVVVFNIITYYKSKNQTDPYLTTFAYIMRVVSYSDRFDAFKDSPFSKEILELKEAAAKMKPFLRGSWVLMSPSRGANTGNPADLLVDYIRILTHIDIIKFNQMYGEVLKNTEAIDTMFTNIGKIDTAVSVCCFRACLEKENGFCVPEFKEGNVFNIEEGYHPLISNPVVNSFRTDKGLLLTGSNASGKSTFLKTCAINAILAQAIHTCTAKSYASSKFRIYTSMALRDDLGGADSYYIVEIKSLKRILDAAKMEGKPILCFIDEVLRGTNTIERIAASAQILKSFTQMNVLCFAATHDVELNDLLKDKLSIYHFAGEVTDNDVHFDYLLHEGPATNRNAIKLLDIIGYDKEITREAEALAERFIEKGVWI
ncbi:MAG: hypothetical protein K6A23_10410 [Butyrivibrio sp.]|nr:hypothetical protein [Butyrivibrio sp.]